MPKINIKIFLPLVLLIIVIVFALFFILQFKSVEEEAGPVEKTLTKEGMEKFYQGLSETATGTKQYINSYTLVENLGEGNFKAEISNLPRITPDGKEINIAWTQKGEGIFESGNNLFAVSVEGAQVTASALFDLSGDIKKGDSAVWNPQVFLNGKEVKSISETPTLLNTDPMNKNYANNVLEWDYGICKRQLRLIEGGVQEFYVFDKDPEGDIKIKSNNEGELKASAYFALDGDKRPIFQGFTFNDKGEKFLTKEAFGLAKYPILVDDSFSGLSSNSDCELVAGSYDYLSARNSTDAKIGYNNGFTTWAVDVGQYQTWNNQYRVMRGFVYFDTSFIPDNATISSAKLKLYGISYYSSTRYIRVLSGQPTYPHDPIQMSDFNQTLYPLTYGGSINANVWTAYGAYQDIGLNSTGIDWIQKGSGAQTKFCLRNSDDIAGNYVERDTFIYSAESGNGPIFEVTYALPSVPQISVTPSSQSFGNVGVGSVKDLTFTVQNTGGGTLSGSISGLTAPFSCVSGCSYSLGASASQTATIRFSPTAVGNFSDTAVFSGAAGASRSVSGSGVIPKCIPTGTTNVNYTISQASLGGGSLCEISGDEGVEGGDITIGSGVTVQVNANSSLVFNPGKRIFVNGIIAKSANNTKVIKGHLGVVACYNDSGCDDGNYCTSDICYNDGTTSSYCSNPAVNRCGDGTCNCGETSSTCSTDCAPACNCWSACELVGSTKTATCLECCGAPSICDGRIAHVPWKSNSNNRCNSCGFCSSGECAPTSAYNCAYTYDDTKPSTYYTQSDHCYYNCNISCVSTELGARAEWVRSSGCIDDGYIPCGGAQCKSSGWDTSTCITGKIVFITSDTYRGYLDGYSGADTKCQIAAFNAGLSGTYKAWISDHDSSPSASLWTHSSGPYINTHGDIIANDWSDLTDNTLTFNKHIQYDAGGHDLGASLYAWTGSNANGTPDGAGSYCTDWTSSSSGAKGKQGWNGDNNYGWSDYTKVGCNNYKHLYCFQQ